MPGGADACPVTESSLPAATLAGFQLIRRLGSGSRAEVYLGAAPLDGVDTAALKVFRAETPRDSITRELTALDRAALPHCVQLKDVAEDTTGTPVAILSRVTGGSVASLLSDRGTLRMGEAITVLAPLAALLPALHSSGVAHGSLSAATIHFGDLGEPVLLGFGHARLFSPGLPAARLDLADGVAADRERLALLAELILGRVGETSATRPVLQWLDALPRPLTGGFAAELEQRLFDRAGATAVDLPGENHPVASAHTAGGSASSPGASTSAPARSTVTTAHPDPAPRRQRSLLTGAAAATGESRSSRWVAAALGASPFQAVRDALVSTVHSVRRPLWITAAAVGAALVAALVLASGMGLGSEHDGEEGPSGGVGQQPTPMATPVVLPDDPVAAVPLLLAERTRCFDDLSVLCLDAVDQSGSTALGEDREKIERTLAGETIKHWRVVGESPALVERLGDSALVTVDAQSEPASVLMIRTEAGWRIREIFAPQGAAG